MAASGAERSRYRYRVLCVDDSDFGAYVEATILGREGYDVLACSDSLQAAEIVQGIELDLAVFSYQMPVLNGAELAALCKAANPDVKVIVLSGRHGVPKGELALADMFVQKSDDMHELLAGLETLLPQNRAQALLEPEMSAAQRIRTEN